MLEGAGEGVARGDAGTGDALPVNAGSLDAAAAAAAVGDFTERCFFTSPASARALASLGSTGFSGCTGGGRSAVRASGDGFLKLLSASADDSATGERSDAVLGVDMGESFGQGGVSMRPHSWQARLRAAYPSF